jgi:tight adherence protein C
MSVLIPLVPGLVAMFALVLLFYGRRLTRSDGVEGLEVADLVLLRDRKTPAIQGGGPLGRVADSLVPTARGLIGPNAVRWLNRQVELAGRPDGSTADSVLRMAIIWTMMVILPFVIFLLRFNLLGMAACAAVVVIMPLARLTRARRLRQEQLDRDLPDFLDILSVTVSAGVAFRPALGRVAERYGGPLAEEISLTLNQIANGASRRQAFSDLRKRNDSEALSQFVTAFLQSEELGAPLVTTLNQIALDMRRTSAQKMRRKAAQTAPRVTLVTSIVLVPGAIVLIVVGMYLGAAVDFGSILGG